MINIDKSFRLLNVDLEVTLTVKEGIFAVDLSNAEIVGSTNNEERTYRVDSDNWCKCLIEV